MHGLHLLHHTNGQMHMYFIASSLPSAMFMPRTDSSQPGWFHIEIYMHILGLRFANTATANHVTFVTGFGKIRHLHTKINT